MVQDVIAPPAIAQDLPSRTSRGNRDSQTPVYACHGDAVNDTRFEAYASGIVTPNDKIMSSV